MAQFGRALRSGRRGRRFKSCHLDHRRNGLCSVPIFLCRKISHALCRSSSFVKSHAQFACSFVNALATAYNRYQLFTILRLRRSQNSLPLVYLWASPVRTLAPNIQSPNIHYIGELFWLFELTNTTGYTRGSQKLFAMNRKDKPPMIE